MELKKFMQPIQDSVVGHPNQKRELWGITSLALLAPGVSLRGDTAYVCAVRDFFAQRYFEAPGFEAVQVVFVCGAGEADCAHGKGFANAVFLSLPEREAFFQLSMRMQQYLDWERQFVQLQLRAASAAELLNTAVEFTACSFFVLNAGGQVLLSAPAEGNASLPSEEAIPCIQINDCYRTQEQLGADQRCVRLHQPFSGSSVILRRLDDQCHLLCVCPTSCTADIPHLLSIMDAPLCAAISRMPPPEPKTRKFSLALSDALEGRITEEREIRRALFPASAEEPDLYYRLLLLEFTQPVQETEAFFDLIRELSSGISNTEFVVYDGRILGLSRPDRREVFHASGKNGFQFDSTIHRGESWLNSVLYRCHARMVISETTSLFSRLRTVYLLALNALRLQQKLAFRGDPLCLYLPDFNLFNILDYAAKYFTQLHGHDDFIYLARSEVSVLYRYDREKNSNLSLVLLNYLLCGKNLDKTAQAVFMHRNTVMNKLEKIREITNFDLSNAYVQADIILSILLLMYKEKILGREFDYELQRIRSQFPKTDGKSAAERTE